MGPAWALVQWEGGGGREHEHGANSVYTSI
jgi:hypothetical protein